MKNPRRGVITGLGGVSPPRAGSPGWDYITAFDPSKYACHVAAEVKDFNPAAFISSRRAKMMGRFSQFALAATRLALDDAGLSITASLSERTAICYGTSVAGLEVAVAGVEDFIARGPGVIKPWT